MKILVTAISFSSKISGIQRHAFNLVRCLLAHPDISAVYLVIAPWQQAMVKSAELYDIRLKIHVVQLESGSISRNVWYYRALPKLANDLQPDVVHLTYPVPINKTAFRCAVVLTLHDLYPYEIPENFRFPHVIFNRLMLRQCLRNVDAMACVSDATLQQLKQFTTEHVWQNAIRIYNCVQPAASGQKISPLHELCGKPFLLCVAQHRRNKNIPLLIRVFGALLARGAIQSSTNLVIVGIPGPETAKIYKTVAQLFVRMQIIFCDGLSDSELHWCYEHCEALVIPSIAEGFGLPLAEGLLAGCRVICSDIPPLQEIGRNDCNYFKLDQNPEEALADAIITSLKQPKPLPITLRQLSPEVLGYEYVRFYRDVLRKHIASVAIAMRDSELRDNSALREV